MSPKDKNIQLHETSVNEKGQSILIVDDNEINRMLLSKMLEKKGFRLFEAANGKEALKIALGKLPDLILLDIMMPEIDGYEVCQYLRERKETTDIPIIFLSAKSETDDKIKGLESGAVDYITKPFSLGEVLARVKAQLKIRSLTKSLKRSNNSLRKALSELEKRQERIEDDLRAAAIIQKSLLPGFSPVLDTVNFAWEFKPSDKIGGDIFNLFSLDDRYLGIYVLDVSGHGVPSAMVAVTVSQLLKPPDNISGNSILKKKIDEPPYYEIAPPGKVLSTLDKAYPIERFEKFFTISYILFDFIEGNILYSNAAHPFPVLVRKNGQMELLDKGGTIIGLGNGDSFEEGSAKLNPGDRLYVYTDGIVEYRNSEKVFFGQKRFYETLIDHRTLPLDETLAKVVEALESFDHTLTPQDDITLLALEFTGK